MKSLIFLMAVSMTGISLATETYEFRIYHLNSPKDAKRWDAWMAAGGLEGFKKAGATRVGAFRPKAVAGEEESKRYLLAVYPSMGAVGKPADESGVEKVSKEAAEAYLNPDPKQPAFERIETALLTAFPSFTKLKDPEGDGGETRFFELRTYENPSERAAALKVEMFGEGGEIEVFESVGLKPVFFGSARVAANLPQLTYMVVHENDEEMDKAWQGFRTSPDWDKLKKNSRYKGTVSKIHKHFFVALPFSELK